MKVLKVRKEKLEKEKKDKKQKGLLSAPTTPMSVPKKRTSRESSKGYSSLPESDMPLPLNQKIRSNLSRSDSFTKAPQSSLPGETNWLKYSQQIGSFTAREFGTKILMDYL